MNVIRNLCASMLLLFMAAGCAFAESSIIMPQDLKVIDQEAFFMAQDLNKIVLCEGVTHINSRAFAGSSLKYINLPSTVSYIADDAFYGCNGLMLEIVFDSYGEKWANASEFDMTIKTCRLGDTGSVVLYIQQSLHTLGYYNGVISGNFGNKTEEAVKLFQKDHGISADGVAGIKTQLMIRAEVNHLNAYTYTIENGGAVITGYTGMGTDTNTKLKIPSTLEKYTGTDTNLKVPSSLEGYPVIAIGNRAFKELKTVTDVRLPATLKTMGDYCFSGCTSLAAIDIPEGVTSIGAGAFLSCTALKRASIPSTVKKLSTTFYGCKNLESVVLSNGLEDLNPAVFYECGKLYDITFPDTLKTIGMDTFYFCTAMEGEHVFPDTITSIHENAFRGNNIRPVCSMGSVTALALGEISYRYRDPSVTDYRFIQKTASTVAIAEYIGSETDVSISPVFKNDTYGEMRVTEIGDYAFNSVSALVSVTIPEGVTSICNQAFARCPLLERVVLPQSVTSIADNIFHLSNIPTVVAVDGSYAHTWCEKNSIPFELAQ